MLGCLRMSHPSVWVFGCIGANQCFRQSARDQGNVEQPITGAGDTLPATIDSKRLHNVPGGVTNDPGAKGSTRATEHARQKPDVEVGASDGPGVQTPIGLEEQSVDAQRDAVDSKQI
jgi:hypothetical protein